MIQASRAYPRLQVYCMGQGTLCRSHCRCSMPPRLLRKSTISAAQRAIHNPYSKSKPLLCEFLQLRNDFSAVGCVSRDLVYPGLRRADVERYTCRGCNTAVLNSSKPRIHDTIHFSVRVLDLALSGILQQVAIDGLEARFTMHHDPKVMQMHGVPRTSEVLAPS